MPIGRRLPTLLVILVLAGAPAVVLRMFCVGSSCEAGAARAEGAVPFCSSPPALRRLVAAGFREGRSPDVMGATVGVGTVTSEVQPGVVVDWPGSAGAGEAAVVPDTRVPLVFFGRDVASAELPPRTALDAVAPTLEQLTGFRRDHPEVRTGEALDVGPGSRSPLVVMIAWKGVGTRDLELRPQAWPFLRESLEGGAGTLEATTGSLPLDPASVLTTVGTGALPSRHGVTGSSVRRDDGGVVPAWSSIGSGSVVATFADDLDHDSRGRALVGALLTDAGDRGIVGDGWYLDGVDRDTIVGHPTKGAAATSAEIVRSEGFGRDDVTDVLGVVLDARMADADRETADLVERIVDLVPEATFVVTGTGSLAPGRGRAIDAADVGAAVAASLGAPVVADATADGLFLDRAVMIDRALTTQQVADVLARRRSPDQQRLFADVYASFAVAFSRYC